MVKLIDKRQAAALLGISPYSINRVMRELPFVRVSPRRIMFDVQDVENYVEARKVQPRTHGGSGGE